MATRAGGRTARIVLGALVGATTGMMLYLWVSSYLGGECAIICRFYRSVIACGLVGGIGTALVDRASGIRRRLSETPGGAEILRRRRQRRALWTGAVFFALMAIFPPWAITRLAEDGRTQLTHPTHYRLLWHPPSVKKGREAASVDIERLLVQWAMVVVLTGVAVAAAALGEKETGNRSGTRPPAAPNGHDNGQARNEARRTEPAANGRAANATHRNVVTLTLLTS